MLLGWRNKYLYETFQNRGEENGMDKLHPNEGIQSLNVLLLLGGEKDVSSFFFFLFNFLHFSILIYNPYHYFLFRVNINPSIF